jgi:hypothetical protein
MPGCVTVDTAVSVATNYFHEPKRRLFGSVREFSFGLHTERGVACLAAHGFLYTSKGASSNTISFSCVLKRESRRHFVFPTEFIFIPCAKPGFELDRFYGSARLGDRRAAGRVAHANSADESAACLRADNVRTEVRTTS